MKELVMPCDVCPIRNNVRCIYNNASFEAGAENACPVYILTLNLWRQKGYNPQADMIPMSTVIKGEDR